MEFLPNGLYPPRQTLLLSVRRDACLLYLV